MSKPKKPLLCKDLKQVVAKILRDLGKKGSKNEKDIVLLFAYNRVGKTRLSMEFKDIGKVKNPKTKKIDRNTLYFNAFTEDLFVWDNDLKGDSERLLRMNHKSRFVAGFKGRDIKPRIRNFLNKYADFDFEIIEKDKKDWDINFSRMGKDNVKKENIKISRGEENLFIWCVFLVALQFVLDKDSAYESVEYIYIDDPISSLDDWNAIAVACEISKMFGDNKRKDDKKQDDKKQDDKKKDDKKQDDKKQDDKKKDDKKREIKIIVSTHHGLFFNALYNDISTEGLKNKTYVLHRLKESGDYALCDTADTPLSYHVAMLGELQHAINNDRLFTYHFNIMRSIMDTTAIFFGYKSFKACLHLQKDENVKSRALSLLSHAQYPVYNPDIMLDDTKELFESIFYDFMDRYKFDITPFAKPNQKETS